MVFGKLRGNSSICNKKRRPKNYILKAEYLFIYLFKAEYVFIYIQKTFKKCDGKGISL